MERSNMFWNKLKERLTNSPLDEYTPSDWDEMNHLLDQNPVGTKLNALKYWGIGGAVILIGILGFGINAYYSESKTIIPNPTIIAEIIEKNTEQKTEEGKKSLSSESNLKIIESVEAGFIYEAHHNAGHKSSKNNDVNAVLFYNEKNRTAHKLTKTIPKKDGLALEIDMSVADTNISEEGIYTNTPIKENKLLPLDRIGKKHPAVNKIHYDQIIQIESLTASKSLLDFRRNLHDIKQNRRSRSNFLSNAEQLKKGALSPNGGLGFTYSNNKVSFLSNVENSTTFFLFSGLTYSLGKGWLVGGGLGYRFSRYDRGQYKVKIIPISINGGAKKYFTTSTKFLPFAALNIANIWQKETQEQISGTMRTVKLFSAIFSFGSDYFIGKNLSLNVRASTILTHRFRGEDFGYNKNMNIQTSFIPFLHKDSNYSGTALNKGNFTISGGLIFSTNFEKISSISVYPNLGYFVTDNFLLGLDINYQKFWISLEGLSNNSNDYSIAPYAKYYHSIQDKMQLFGELMYRGYKDIQDKYTNSYRIGAGFNYFLNDNVAIESGLFYTFEDNSQFSLQLSSGLKYFLNNKNKKEN